MSIFPARVAPASFVRPGSGQLQLCCWSVASMVTFRDRSYRASNRRNRLAWGPNRRLVVNLAIDRHTPPSGFWGRSRT